MKNNWDQYAVNDQPDNQSASVNTPSTNWDQYAAQPKANSQETPKTIDTLFGKMPALSPQEAFKSIASPDNVNAMIDIGTGTPGMEMVGRAAVPGILSIGKSLIGKITPAFKNLAPYEKSAAEAQAAASQATDMQKLAKGLRPGEIAEGEPQTPVQAIEDQVGRQLKIDSPHKIRVAEALRNRISSVEDYWSGRYKNLMDNLKSSSFQMPEEAMKELNMNDIYKQIQEGGFEDVKAGKIGEQQSPYFTDLISRAPTSADTNAADFISKYKDFRNGIYNLRETAKSTGDEALRRQLFSDVNKLKTMEDTAKNTLEKGLGEHLQDFKEINNGYSQQIFPLRSNAIVRNINKGGSMSDNIVNQLSNNKEGTDVLREMAKQDPEVVKSIIGQRYRISPGEVHNPNELMREYLDEAPDVKNLLKTKQDTLQEIAGNAKTSLEDKVKAESQLAKMRGSKKSAQKLIGKSAVYGLGGLGIGGIYGAKNILSSLLNNQNSGEQ